MEIEINPKISPDVQLESEINFKKITEYLIKEKNVYLKNQQRDESEISFEEKAEIIQNVYNKGAIAFLTKFGKYLKPDHLQFFIKFENDSEEVKNLLHNFHKANDRRTKRTRNRRFAALKHMVENESYFSETEMMKRNPLLYEQLVGQYLTTEEKKERDLAIGNTTLVDILMEGLERDEAESQRKKEEMDEMYCGDTSEESSSDEENGQTQKTEVEIHSETTKAPLSQPSRSLWGEYTNQNVSTTSWEEMSKPSSSSSISFNKQKHKNKSLQSSSNQMITASERRLLRDEFVTTMYENFLEGKDEDFDYTNVDDNEEYDNLELIDRDEEEKYFDSEEPENLEMEADGNQKSKEGNEDEQEESSEDELDIYMSALNQHPAVCQLSKDIEKL